LFNFGFLKPGNEGYNTIMQQDIYTDDIKELAKKAGLQPQEALLEERKHDHHLSIGVPCEITYQENRIALTPTAVHLLVNNGHEVSIESGAGLKAHFTDKEFSDAGAKILYSPEEVFKCEIVLKVSPPTMEEINWMQQGQVLISAIQPAELKPLYIHELMKRGVTALAYEYIRDEWGSLPVIRSMSEIAGSTSILIASEYLSNVNNGKGELLGGITGVPPTEVIIIGSGTVGEYATRAALGLGAEVKVFDNSLYRLRRLQNNIGSRVYTSLLNPKILGKALLTADVAVGALRSEEGMTPTVVSENMVRNMKKNSVIVDVSIDQGGCFDTSEVTSHDKPVFTKHDVVHYCVPNISSRVSRTASYALSNIFSTLLLKIANSGGLRKYIWQKNGVREGIYIYKGRLTNKHIAYRFDIPFKDIELLIPTL
jgi:alanine dehydrogenase